MKRSAVYSECGRYRFELRRVWDDTLPPVLFIALNPSTGDYTERDNSTAGSMYGFRRKVGLRGVTSC